MKNIIAVAIANATHETQLLGLTRSVLRLWGLSMQGHDADGVESLFPKKRARRLEINDSSLRVTYPFQQRVLRSASSLEALIRFLQYGRQTRDRGSGLLELQEREEEVQQGIARLCTLL